MINYYDIYDKEYDFKDDIEFCETLLSKGSVLEVGCGTGRVLSYLKDNNKYKLKGLDIDKDAIKIAKDKFKNDDIRVTVDDAILFKHDGKYENILFLFNGLMHISNKDDQMTFLSNAFNHLKDDGNLIFYVSNPDINRMSESFPYYKYQKTLNINKILVDKFEYNKYDLNNQLIHRVFNYDYINRDNNLNRIVSRFTVRYFSRRELEVILTNTGFKRIEWYGDFDGSQWSCDSQNIIVKAIK